MQLLASTCFSWKKRCTNLGWRCGKNSCIAKHNGWWFRRGSGSDDKDLYSSHHFTPTPPPLSWQYHYTLYGVVKQGKKQGVFKVATGARSGVRHYEIHLVRAGYSAHPTRWMIYWKSLIEFARSDFFSASSRAFFVSIISFNQALRSFQGERGRIGRSGSDTFCATWYHFMKFLPPTLQIQ